MQPLFALYNRILIIKNLNVIKRVIVKSKIMVAYLNISHEGYNFILSH